MKEPVVIRLEETSREELFKLDRYLPTDTHLVRYLKGETEIISAVSAYCKANIFDEFYDQGFTVLEISAGYGRIKPKLFSTENLNEARL